jgi:type IV pilus assembly protein PilO
MKINTQAFSTFINEKYLPLEKKPKIVGAAVLLILPIIIFFFVWYQPKSKEMAALTLRKNTATQELEKARTTAKTIDNHRAMKLKVEEQFAETAVLFPKEKEIPRLLTDISAEGQSAGLEFLTFKPLAAVPKEFYSEIPIDIQVRGPFHNLGNFLYNVSKLNRIVSVANVKISASNKSEGEILLDSSCRLVTYQFTNVKLDQPKK